MFSMIFINGISWFRCWIIARPLLLFYLTFIQWCHNLSWGLSIKWRFDFMSHALLDMLLLNEIIWPYMFVSHPSPFGIKWRGTLKSSASDTFHITEWNKSKTNHESSNITMMIYHSGSNYRSELNLSAIQIAFVTFIKETSVFWDSKSAFPFQRWIKSWIMGSNYCRTWHTHTQSIASSHTHTHTCTSSSKSE